jgi:hypothetical protein
MRLCPGPQQLRSARAREFVTRWHTGQSLSARIRLLTPFRGGDCAVDIGIPEARQCRVSQIERLRPGGLASISMLRGRVTVCTGLGPIDGLDRGAPCWPSQSRSSCRSGTRTVWMASARAIFCLWPLPGFTAHRCLKANRQSSRETPARSRPDCRSSTARFASSSQWGLPRCPRRRQRPPPRSLPAKFNLRPTRKPQLPHREIFSSRPGRRHSLDAVG